MSLACLQQYERGLQCHVAGHPCSLCLPIFHKPVLFRGLQSDVRRYEWCQEGQGGTLTGLFAIVFLAAIFGVFKPYIKGAKRWHFGLGAFVAFILVGAFAEPTSKPAGQTDKASVASSARSDSAGDTGQPEASPTPQESASAWTYSTKKDEMRGGEALFAQLEGSNTIDLDFPYGEQRGQILIRQSPKFGFDILVGVRSGQIMCNSYSNSSINVKFDDGPIRRYGCTEASDGSSNMVFIEGAKGFLANLKKSQKVVVEAEFFQNGLQQMTFDSANLKWEN